uniref:IlGF domain-containing protein n=1 Tax=Panagrellus redivivus TaxID=6233 RepID=A0A7E4ZWR7_PANRE
MSSMTVFLAVSTVCLVALANGHQPRLFLVDWDDEFDAAPAPQYIRRWGPSAERPVKSASDLIQISKKDSPTISCGLIFVRRVDKVCKGCSKAANKEEITKRSSVFRPKRDALGITVQCCMKGCTDADLKQLCCTS